MKQDSFSASKLLTNLPLLLFRTKDQNVYECECGYVERVSTYIGEEA